MILEIEFLKYLQAQRKPQPRRLIFDGFAKHAAEVFSEHIGERKMYRTFETLQREYSFTVTVKPSGAKKYPLKFYKLTEKAI